MAKSIGDFVEQYVNGEPLTTRTIAWAIRKYIRMNYGPNKQEELDKYKQLLHKIAYLNESGNKEELEILFRNIYLWSIARKNPPSEQDDENIICQQNETFYNLLN